MNAPTILGELDIPKSVMEASMLVSNWMEEHGHRDWVCMGLASRFLYEKMACEIANLKAEHDTVKKELDQINGQLITILKDVQTANENLRRFQEDVMKVTTLATLEHVRNFKR